MWGGGRSVSDDDGDNLYNYGDHNDDSLNIS